MGSLSLSGVGVSLSLLEDELPQGLTNLSPQSHDLETLEVSQLGSSLLTNVSFCLLGSCPLLVQLEIFGKLPKLEEGILQSSVSLVLLAAT